MLLAFFNVSVTYGEARALCGMYNSELVELLDEQEWNEVC